MIEFTSNCIITVYLEYQKTTADRKIYNNKNYKIKIKMQNYILVTKGIQTH